MLQVCIFYTTIGGLKAVIWTNVFQAGCMFFSSLTVVIIGEYAVGGSAEVFRSGLGLGRKSRVQTN